MMSDLGAAVSFELVKIRSLRSTAWNLAAFLIVSTGSGVLTGWYVRTSYPGLGAQARADLDPVGIGHSGLRLGLIALVVLGVLMVASEYSSGTIHSSLAAVPRRDVFYLGKITAGALVALASSVVVVIVNFAATQVALGEHRARLGDGAAARTTIGAVLYTTLLCLFAMGVAALLRSSALSIGILVPLLFIVSTLLTNIPGVRDVAQFLPDVAGGLVLLRDAPPDGLLTPWTGLAVLAAWTALALGAGYLAVRNRDA